MDTEPEHHLDPPEAAIDALLLQQARLAGDVIEVEHDTWAIHATIPVDGEVIVAEFRRPEAAREALSHYPVDRFDRPAG
jgi:hypothetical protein